MRIALAQLNQTLGDLAGNAARIREAIAKAEGDRADMVVFSETAITGYTPMDLVRIPGFIEEQLEVLDGIRMATEGRRAVVVLGCITRNPGPGKNLFNALVVLRDGKVLLEYHKTLLPTYNIFDERRYFEPGTAANVLEWQGRKIAFLICEDAWGDKSDGLYRDNPVRNTFAAHPDVDLLVTVNASPSDLGKRQRRLEVYRDIARSHRVPLVYVNQVGGHDGVVFDGGSFAMDREGALIGKGADFEECLTLVDFDRPGSADGYAIPEPELIYRQVKLGLSDYVRKTGAFKGVVVGESGGIDSAVVTAIAVDALGADRVKAITMPSHVSSEGSVKDSETLCRNLGVEIFTLPIKEQFAKVMECFDGVFGPGCPVPSVDGRKLTEQNTQSRLRGMALMAFSNRMGYLVLNTGNKSELSVGYFTLGGDSMGGLAILGDLFKMQVYALGRYYNELHGKELIPEAILAKEPSAELEPGQVDSRDLPAYPVLDAILRLYVEQVDMTEAERRACQEIIARKSGPEEVNRVLRMVTLNEHKRSVVPRNIRVNNVAFGAGWAMPIAQGYVPTAAALLI